MYKIYIDTSNRKEKSLTLLSTEHDKDTVIEKLIGDMDIVGSIDSLLKKHNLKPDDISEYVSNPGPGSFTGLKLGATVANIMNWAVHGKDLKDMKYPDYGGEPNIQGPKS